MLGMGDTMLVALATGVRLRLATLVAAISVFSFVAPPIAVAFAPTKSAIHCLTHADDEFALQVEAIQPDSANDHKDHVKHSRGDHRSACCCLFSATALIPDSGHLSEPGLSSSPAFSALEASFYGLMQDRLDRPPITLLSF